MEVMDLSMPKPQPVQSYKPPPSYSILQQHQQQHYMLQQQYFLQQQHLLQLQQQHQQQQFTMAQPLPLIPTQPSVTHLGYFQQLQYNSLPPAPTTTAIQPSGVSMVGPNMHQQSQTSPVSQVSPSKDAAKSRESENNNRPHLPVKRPFKLISKSPTALAIPSIMDPKTDAAYEQYRNKIMSQVARNESEPNRNMRRTIPFNPEKLNDPEYLERRRKNNEAAKKSREARKAKEDEIAIRVTFLERENLKLKFQLAAIERQKKMYLLRVEQKQQNRHNMTACF